MRGSRHGPMALIVAGAIVATAACGTLLEVDPAAPATSAPDGSTAPDAGPGGPDAAPSGNGDAATTHCRIPFEDRFEGDASKSEWTPMGTILPAIGDTSAPSGGSTSLFAEAKAAEGGSFLELPLPTPTTANCGFVLSFWFRRLANTGAARIVVLADGAGAERAAVNFVETQLDLIVDGTSTPTDIPLAGAWHRLRLEWSGGTVQLTINGGSPLLQPATNVAPPTVLRIGAVTPLRAFAVNIDDVRVE